MPKRFTLPILSESFHLSHSSNMNIKASTFLKQVASVLTSIVRAKSMALKSKTSAMKTRLLIFGILRNKKVLMSAISHKIHALTGQQKEMGASDGNEDNSKAIVLSEAQCQPRSSDLVTSEGSMFNADYEDDDDDDRYPDLRHSLFDTDDEDDLGGCTGSVIDMVRNSKEEHGEEFKLEDEIDHVADMFIRRFRKHMKLEKLESFKRYKEMMERST